ncbi:MAG: AAA family ATPase [Planctomycetales bacterium]|nr:AAA family ATPase [Planctomycetales bacterium]
MLIHELRLAGLLSFGPDTPALPMRPLNILVGPNGSGKSNFIEAIGLQRSAASKLAVPIRGTGGGGVGEWIWKGAPDGSGIIDAVIENPGYGRKLRHFLEFGIVSKRFELLDERIENAEPDPGHDDPYFYYRYQNGHPVLSVRGQIKKRQLERQDLALDESILTQRREPDQYPELAYLADQYDKVRLYRDWTFGRKSVHRSFQQADLPGDRLEEDFSNLNLFLNRISSDPKTKRLIVEKLQNLYEGITDFGMHVVGGALQLSVTEGDYAIPASRLSDGTLRFLCLLAILCDPNPAPLICIEEPELGMHPDMLAGIADLLIEASERTQLVVTTHSDILIDAMTDQPESVVVFDKQDGLTTANRLNAEDLNIWLKDYRLGRLWTDGQIGGVRW